MKRDPVTPSDVEIIDWIAGGDVEAFRLLVERYSERVFDIVSRRVPRQDCEAVAHEVFVRSYLSLASYGGRGDFGAWLAKIAARSCYDFWRERYRRREREESSLSDEERRWILEVTAERSAVALEREESASEARSLLDRILSKLSPEDRAVIELVHIEERPVKEVAELLGWSAVNVKVRALRARRKMRALLGELLEEREDSV